MMAHTAKITPSHTLIHTLFHLFREVTRSMINHHSTVEFGVNHYLEVTRHGLKIMTEVWIKTTLETPWLRTCKAKLCSPRLTRNITKKRWTEFKKNLIAANLLQIQKSFARSKSERAARWLFTLLKRKVRKPMHEKWIYLRKWVLQLQTSSLVDRTKL